MWIEIKRLGLSSFAFWSPSARKVWIEMQIIPPCDKAVRSPSARKVWIEINLPPRKVCPYIVAFRKEGVD